MKFFDTLNDVVIAVINEIENQGARVRITGGSVQSCSTYFDLNGVAVRISDHAPRTQLSVVDYHIGLNSDHGDDFLDAHEVYERTIFEFNDDEEVVSQEIVECEEDDEDAELVGFRVSESEIKRVARCAIESANEINAEEEEEDEDE